ncbi:MAG: ComEC/Rec2 family competence protein [Sphingobacteriales bacterium]|nr:ComEC/Rec2 family competence protein [Sphingobacteriales bacterium]MBP9140949.1 ComEC/Rec2 family competence protein [Chitinophagales bacterium]MDA0198739.1 ComEC/Rec2 family competence protein [Bacteroidota bacterium]MBK6889361.1 ComEC/Rec2 family competence protein [Sphingobacteriales bacterium]MBK7528139.1 ComEC/Rec2 family competence protein [Sphingobacteriales bacterium]
MQSKPPITNPNIERIIPYIEQLPALRLLLPFVIGIIAAYYFFGQQTEPWWWAYAITAACLPLLVVALFFFRNIKSKKTRQIKVWFGVCMAVAFFLLGLARTLQQNQFQQPTHFRHFITSTDSSATLLLQIQEPLIAKTRSYKTTTKVLGVYTNENSTQLLQPAQGKILTYLALDSAAAALQYGDLIVAQAQAVALVDSVKNPGAFDYRQYLQFEQIYHRAWLASGKWLPTQQNQGNWFFAKIYYLRSFFLDAIARYVPGKDEASVAAALLIGYTHLLDDEIVKAYSATGAMHVLAVSGMHVVILYGLLQWLLRLIFGKHNTKSVRLLRLLLGLGFIWIFAVITGLPPSVVRAAVMISLVMMADFLQRRSNVFNSIAVSALVILFFQPLMLFKVGFQLSYGAVLGILLWQAPIYRVWLAPNALLNLAWEITSVSIAAQIGTLPLVLYYFHQFPTYALLANIVAVPLSGWVLYAGIALFFTALFAQWTSVFAFVSQGVGWVMYGLVWFQNHFLTFMGSLPGALIQGYMTPISSAVLLFVTIVGVAQFLQFKQTKWLLSGLISLTIVGVQTLYDAYQNSIRNEITVYSISGGTAIDITQNRRSVLLLDSAGLAQMPTQIQPNLWKKGVGRPQIIRIENFEMPTDSTINQFSNSNIVFNQKVSIQYPTVLAGPYQFTFLSVNKSPYNAELVPKNEKIKTHYAILRKNAQTDLIYSQQTLLFDSLLIDGSNTQRFAQKTEQICGEAAIPIYNLRKSAALTLSW